MAYTEPKNLIISAGVLKNGSDVFAILDPDSGGAATFSVALSADGLPPATHYGARTMLEEATYNVLKTMTTTQFKAYVDQVQIERGRTAVGSVTSFKNSLLMGEGTQSFWDFAAANGLKAVVEQV